MDHVFRVAISTHGEGGVAEDYQFNVYLIVVGGV